MTKTVTFNNDDEVQAELVKRARAVLGFRGIATFRTEPLNGNAVQHGVRILISRAAKEHKDGKWTYTVDDDLIAEHSRHVATETIYWSDLR